MRSKRSLTIVAVLITSVFLIPSSPAAADTPAQAVAAAAASASGRGVTSFISVVDRSTGAVVGQTANAGAQVASESIMKLFLAAYYLKLYGGWQSTPQSVLDRLSFMLRYSDDDTASSLFTESAIPTIAAGYSLNSTINATDRPGHWGAARITAADMTTFLYRAFSDPAVGPWLNDVMAQTAPTGSGADAGFSQYFGLNALSGVHGSKQGWGCDSFWTSPQCAIHSVGYTDRYFVAVLQLGGYPDPMRATSTNSASLVQQSTLQLVNGDFLCNTSTGEVYRLVGGAPVYVSSWNPFGGPRPCRPMSAGEIDQLPRYPADGTFLRDPFSGAVYRMAGGAPLYVSTWAAFGGGQPTTDIDPAAIDNAGAGGAFDHLRTYPADGTFLRASASGAVYRIAGGAPLYVSTWTPFGGTQPAVDVDTAAIDNAGAGSYFNHLRAYPTDGTFLRGLSTGAVYRVAGGAPVYITAWSAGFGDQQAIVNLDSAAIDNAATGGYYNHLRTYPADGTFLRASASGAVYRIAGGAPLYVSTWTPFGGTQPAVDVDTAAIDNAGAGSYFNHLRAYPTDGTFLRGLSTGAVYRVAGGAPVYITAWSAGFGDQQAIVNLDSAAIDNAATGGYYNHLRTYPTDGTFLRAISSGAVYRVAGGAPLYLTAWLSEFGDQQAIVNIDGGAIDRAGSGTFFNGLRFSPADDTFVEGLPGGRIYRVVAGIGTYVPSWTPFGGPQPYTSITQQTIDLAGAGGFFDHLKPAG